MPLFILRSYFAQIIMREMNNTLNSLKLPFSSLRNHKQIVPITVFRVRFIRIAVCEFLIFFFINVKLFWPLRSLKFTYQTHFILWSNYIIFSNSWLTVFLQHCHNCYHTSNFITLRFKFLFGCLPDLYTSHHYTALNSKDTFTYKIPLGYTHGYSLIN